MTLMLEIIAVLIVIACLLWAYVKRSQNYWPKRNIPYIEPNSIFGNINEPLNKKFGLAHYTRQWYNELKRRGYKHGGVYLFTKPIYIPVDTVLIKNILTKDFSHFPGHGMFVDEVKDPLLSNITTLDGEKWRFLRTKLTPTFTSGKMKLMFQTLLECGALMINHIDKLCKNKEMLNAKEILSCYTTNVIVSCAFGLECNSFENPNSEFRIYGRKIFETNIKTELVRFLGFVSQRLSRLTPLKLIPMEIETFFMSAVRKIIDYRNNNSVKRNDFMQLLLDMNEKAKSNGDEALTFREIAAQAFVFFLAGFETSSTTMTFCLHELAFNQDIQDTLRVEIQAACKQNNGVLTYDTVMGMKYLDKVVNETLRKYPPAPFLSRVCAVDYKIPETESTIEKGTAVIISTLGLHRDEEFYPNPDKFDPERFSEESKNERSAFSFLPFGEGPRICIGMRFGLMLAKTGLAVLLNSYRFFPAKNEEYNFEFDSRIGVLAKKGTTNLNAEKLPK